MPLFYIWWFWFSLKYVFLTSWQGNSDAENPAPYLWFAPSFRFWDSYAYHEEEDKKEWKSWLSMCFKITWGLCIISKSPTFWACTRTRAYTHKHTQTIKRHKFLGSWTHWGAGRVAPPEQAWKPYTHPHTPTPCLMHCLYLAAPNTCPL